MTCRADTLGLAGDAYSATSATENTSPRPRPPARRCRAYPLRRGSQPTYMIAQGTERALNLISRYGIVADRLLPWGHQPQGLHGRLSVLIFPHQDLRPST